MTLPTFFKPHTGSRISGFPVASLELATQVCAVLAGAAFLLSGLVYLCLGHWTATHQDFWRIYDVCLNHTWLESALLKHNGHSLFFPSFLWLADIRFFHGNQELIFYAALSLLLVSVLLVLVPIWGDTNIGTTAKTLATLVVIVGNLWMGRANITASGGFNWVSSLLLAGAETAFIWLPLMRTDSGSLWPATVVVVVAGFIASFSFGAGLVIWPALLFLAWCLRLPWRSLGVLTLSGLTAVIVFVLLPPPWSPPRGAHTQLVLQSTLDIGLERLCRMLGTPIFYAASGWYARRLPAEVAQSSAVVLWCGAIGLMAALLIMGFAAARRSAPLSGLKLMGLALVAFNVMAIILIVIGRADHFRRFPFEVVAARYLFFSTLFWTGLLLLAIDGAESKRWLRWPIYVGVFMLPILLFPSHYKEGRVWRRATRMAEGGAASLISGVRDDQEVEHLFRNPKWVYRVAEELRVRRLDMFAEGLQDWLGINKSALFGGRHKRTDLKGKCRIDALLQCDNGTPAARISGQLAKHRHSIPRTLVILNSAGVICGVALSSTVYSASPLINRAFYLSKFEPRTTFVGYIRGYDPNEQYEVRSVCSMALSEETIAVSHGPQGTSTP